MNPFFFGDSKEPLYGVYHPPAAASKDEAIVLCYPYGQEAMRCHRAFRQLALLLARQGFHVLRFDYRGTGDSALDIQQVELNTWLADINQALDELKEMSGVNKISIAGLRLGALLAAAAVQDRGDIHRIVLWDPVVSGQFYVDDLLARIDAIDPQQASNIERGNFVDERGNINYNGFAIPSVFQKQLGELNFESLSLGHAAQAMLCVSHDSEGFDQVRRQIDYAGLTFASVPAPHDWSYVDKFGGILIPHPNIQAIVDWLA